MFLSYIPAQVSDKKICRVFYYAIDPATEKLKRVVVKCNRLKSKSQNLALAKRMCEEINIRLRDGWNPFTEKLEAAGFVSLDFAIQRFLTEKSRTLRKDSMRSYYSLTGTFSQWLKECDLLDKNCLYFSRRHAENFMRYISNRGNVSNKTFNNYLRHCKTLFNYFIDHDYIKENPFDKIHIKRESEKLRTTIPPEDLRRIKDYFQEKEPIFNYVIYLCNGYLIRPKEILMLRIGYLDFQNAMLTIPASVSKNHDERIIALHDDMMELLRIYQNLPADLYFFSTGYKPGKKLLSSREIGKTWSQMRIDLGMPKEYQFYSLKDTGVTDMLESGVPAKLVKELAGHHSLNMTEKYLHKSTARAIRDAIHIKL